MDKKINLDSSSKKRSKMDIIRDILRVIYENNNSVAPTKLMRTSNLSFQMFTDYIEELKYKGFVLEKINGKRSIYSLSIKGQNFFFKFKEFTQFLEEFGF